MLKEKKGGAGSNGRGRWTGRQSEATESWARESERRGITNWASVVRDDVGQASVAALMLDQLMDAVGVQVRQ